jgi:DNA-binding NarL/FixJ family response regulator
LQLVKEIAANYKDVAPLVLSMHDERVYAVRALRAGARGYVMKHQATRRVVGAIRQVAAGALAVSEEMALRLESAGVGPTSSQALSIVETLTDRELEVFQLIGQGLKTHEIGERLHLSVKTIETHREHIKEKLNIPNASELAQQAIAWVHGEGKDALLNPT